MLLFALQAALGCSPFEARATLVSSLNPSSQEAIVFGLLSYSQADFFAESHDITLPIVKQCTENHDCVVVVDLEGLQAGDEVVVTVENAELWWSTDGQSRPEAQERQGGKLSFLLTEAPPPPAQESSPALKLRSVETLQGRGADCFSGPYQTYKYSISHPPDVAAVVFEDPNGVVDHVHWPSRDRGLERIVFFKSTPTPTCHTAYFINWDGSQSERSEEVCPATSSSGCSSAPTGNFWLWMFTGLLVAKRCKA